MKRFALIACSFALVGFVGVGCSAKKDSKDTTETAVAKTEETKAVTPPKVEVKEEVPKAEPTEAAANNEGATETAKVGVAECDEYVAKMNACFEKMPAAVRDSQKKAFDNVVAAWARMTGPAKDNLGTACKAAQDAAAQAMKAHGCEF